MINLFAVHMPTTVDKPLLETLHSGYIGQGPKVEEFERALALYLENENILTLNSGTSAIELALHLAGVKPGTSVVATPMTCSATNTSILSRGAKIIWADIDPDTGLIDTQDVIRKIEDDTVAVVGVDWGGRAVDWLALSVSAAMYGVRLIEDAAHALGGLYGLPRAKVGNGLVDFTCFSASTPIRTSVGDKPISEVEIGDFVVSGNGKLNRVSNILSREYSGQFTNIKLGQIKFSSTADHPIKVFRNGQDSWIKAQEVVDSDFLYVSTKYCSECKKELVPIYGNKCQLCYSQINISVAKARNLSTIKKGMNIVNGVKSKTLTSRLIHHTGWVAPVMEQYREQGYRVIPTIHAIPDFIAVKDGKISAIEVQSHTTTRLAQREKYNKLNGDGYDEVIWILQEKKKQSKGRYSYEIVGDLARVPVASVVTGLSRPLTQTVYNLTVENDPTYFARNVLVHNCFSLQAIKTITSVDGGILTLKRSSDYKRGKLLRWYGIDRETDRKDMRCEEDILEAGWKWHMNDVNATIGLIQLQYLDGLVTLQRDNAKYYFEHLEGPQMSVTQEQLEESSFWLYTILCEDQEQRLRFMAYMKEHGIMTSQVHSRNDTHTCFRPFFRNPLPGVDKFTQRQVSIPCHWALSEQEKEKIVSTVNQFFAKETVPATTT